MKALVIIGSLISYVSSQATLFKGRGFGTYYYDVKQPKAGGTDFTNQNKGSVMCSWILGETLDDINSNNLVAMSSASLSTSEGRAKYCGKRVKVAVNGVTSDTPFFVGDGCQRCAVGSDVTWNPNGAQGLDFSFSALSKLSPEAFAKGHVDISYEIVDDTIFTF